MPVRVIVGRWLLPLLALVGLSQSVRARTCSVLWKPIHRSG